ncbi:UvrB/UvrC motif-containing protein [Halobacillus shinanisalinarum]|uniref:UvrB/UvrC motif-containing protein n=1 Tax=Halobacillus shinanisalinarum TaxID=2932258 RepID=A0ABY4GU13_9BACI|nr:UvrB/UvrC motif-containing protein [Halobacillus shinanisalinarum]UOQ91383.1 UvrB/UvrC motif-containing protein [Halobacillus shinanisalinarum]
MECQRCHNRAATVHLTQLMNGEKTEVHVCEQCAKEKGYMHDHEENFTLNDLLTGLFNFEPKQSPNGQQTGTQQPKEQLKCPKCGLTFKEFARAGKFGCAECYKTFDERLNPILRRVHSGNTHHDGKIPRREGGNLHLRRQKDQYKSELQRLIEQEEFEEAAKLRDEIRSLDDQLQDREEGES